VAQEVSTPPEDQPGREPKRSILSFFKELPVLILLALGIALLIKTFLVQAFYIPSASMEPTLEVGDRVLVNKLSYRFGEPERGQIIVFKDPYGDPCDVEPGEPMPDFCERGAFRRAFDWFGELFGLPTGTTKDFIKRIVALPGETVEMREGVVHIDGDPVEFPSAPDQGPREDTYTMEPIQLGDDEYYVLGDNRANSSDSRVFEAISEDSIIGRAFVVVWPPTRFSGL
jgi:signal peptidase I